MAHFAKINEENKVLAVFTLNNEDILNADGVETESVGQQYLETHNNWPAHLWIQTSYNTKNNKHYTENSNGEVTESLDQSKAFRGNYAGIGYTWDSENQIFWMPKPYFSWTRNITTASWDPPISYPTVVDDGADPVVWYWSIYWDDDAYQNDNTKGWKGTKKNIENPNPDVVTEAHSDTAIYDWNGTIWISQ
jgi:hypothetical protein